jgi:hypothetical protein
MRNVAVDAISLGELGVHDLCVHFLLLLLVTGQAELGRIHSEEFLRLLTVRIVTARTVLPGRGVPRAEAEFLSHLVVTGEAEGFGSLAEKMQLVRSVRPMTIQTGSTRHWSVRSLRCKFLLVVTVHAQRFGFVFGQGEGGLARRRIVA